MDLLGTKIDAIPTSEVVRRFQGYLEDGQKHHIVTTNPEFIVEAQQNKKFADIINTSDLSLIDGIGVLIGLYYVLVYGKNTSTSKFMAYVDLVKCYLQIMRSKQPIVIDGNYLQRTTGTDLVWLITQQDWMKFRKVYLLGGTHNVAARAAKRLNAINPDIQFRCSNGHQNIKAAQAEESSRVIDDINQFNPDILLVAYGHPWQDIWIDSVKNVALFKIAIGVGGAFDYVANEVRRAPVWLRNLGLEWAYRLFREPKRYQRIVTATLKFCDLLITKKS